MEPAEGEANGSRSKCFGPVLKRPLPRSRGLCLCRAEIERFSPSSRRLEPVKLVETLAASVRMELDLRLEAAASAEIAELMQPADAFIVPKIDWRLTSRRMLTAPWIDGIRLDDHAALETAGFDRHSSPSCCSRCF